MIDLGNENFTDKKISYLEFMMNSFIIQDESRRIYVSKMKLISNLHRHSEDNLKILAQKSSETNAVNCTVDIYKG